MGSREGLALRQLALEALEKSTKMFELAFKLQTQGNQVEAERVRNDARTQRNFHYIDDRSELPGGRLEQRQFATIPRLYQLFSPVRHRTTA